MPTLKTQTHQKYPKQSNVTSQGPKKSRDKLILIPAEDSKIKILLAEESKIILMK